MSQLTPFESAIRNAVANCLSEITEKIKNDKSERQLVKKILTNKDETLKYFTDIFMKEYPLQTDKKVLGSLYDMTREISSDDSITTKQQVCELIAS